MDPPPPGVSPVLIDDSLGVGNPPLRCPSKRSFEPVGPVSIAGLSGPERREFGQLKPPLDVPPGRRDAGDVRAATGGNSDFPGVSTDGLPKDCSKGLGSKEKWLLLCTEEK
jgi:hypothetical protein